METMPELTADIEKEREEQLSAIHSLRSSIEQEHMFRTGLVGFNKREVQEYLNGISGQYQRAAQEHDEEMKRLEQEKRQLCARLEEQKKKLSDARGEERRKLQAENSLQEGLVENLRERNSRLMAENQAKQVEITVLREQLSRVRAIAAERSEQLDTLSRGLEELLAGKLRECGDVIKMWKTEFADVVAAESREIAEPIGDAV